MRLPPANGFLAERPPVAPWEWATLAAITAAGAVLRFWALSTLQPGLWYDEAINGLDALSILREPGMPLFFTTNGHPREPLYMYLELLGVLAGGTNGTAIRAVSGVLGTLAIPATWWMVREWRGPREALLAAGILAGMRWHVHFSRLAFRTILSPLFAAVAGALLARVIRKRQLGESILLGVVLGGALYTYLSMRLFLVAVAIAGVIALWRGLKGEGAHCPKRATAWAVVAALLTFAPLGLHFVQNPADFRGREDQVSLFDQGAEGWARIAVQARDVALAPLLRGDHEGKHNLPGPPRFVQLHGWAVDPGLWAAEWADARRLGDAPDPHGTGVPLFDPLTGLLFYGALVLAAARALRGDWPSQFALLWLALGSLASILSFGAPNQLRLLLLTPLCALLLADGAGWVLDAAREKGRARAAAVLVGLWLAGFTALEAKRYFHDWPRHPEVYFKFNTNLVEVARWLREQADLPPTIVAQEAVLFGAPTFAFEADGVRGIVSDLSLDRAPQGRTWWLAPQGPFPPLAVAPGEDARVVKELELPGGMVWLRVIETGG